MHMQITIKLPSDFSLRTTVFSHGWCMLEPFSVSEDPLSLSYAAVIDGIPIDIYIRELNAEKLVVRIQSNKKLPDTRRTQCRALVKSIVRLDEPFDEFYQDIKKEQKLHWIIQSKAGRMLRCGSFFEDLIKVVCTTNCSWGLTTVMVQNLCYSLGEEIPTGRRTFPLPEVIAGQTESFMRKEIRAGYRSPYILELAALIASGKLNVEEFRNTKKSTDELYRELVSLKGVGPYAAESLLKLIGRYDHLALDSWTRKKYYELYHNGRQVTDTTIKKRYAKFGQWAGLVFWLEMTRYWYDEKFPLH